MATRKPFTLYRRNYRNRHIYYFRLNLPDGTRTPGRSTGQSSKGAAERWVYDYLEKYGMPTVASRRIRLDGWAKDFWDEQGRYVRLRRAHGHRLSSYYVTQRAGIVRNYLIPAFGTRYLEEITPEAVENYLLDLYENGHSPYRREGEYKQIGARTVNAIRGCLKTIMAEAVRLGHLRYNPVDATHKFREQPRERGTLSRAELWALLFRPGVLETVWDGDRLYYLFALTAAITGMRRGELRALIVENVHQDWIAVNHGWDEAANAMTDAPKWGKRRIATIPALVGDLLHSWIADVGLAPDDFIFRSTVNPRTPVTGHTVKRRFDTALSKIGICENRRKMRNLVFHSLRHSLATAMRAQAVDSWQARALVGHTDERMFEHYADHATPELLGDVREFQLGLMKNPLVNPD